MVITVESRVEWLLSASCLKSPLSCTPWMANSEIEREEALTVSLKVSTSCSKVRSIVNETSSGEVRSGRTLRTAFASSTLIGTTGFEFMSMIRLELKAMNVLLRSVARSVSLLITFRSSVVI